MPDTKHNPHVVFDWSEAYDWCRDVNRPMWFKVGDEIRRCFPSGRFEPAQPDRPSASRSC